MSGGGARRRAWHRCLCWCCGGLDKAKAEAPGRKPCGGAPVKDGGVAPEPQTTAAKRDLREIEEVRSELRRLAADRAARDALDVDRAAKQLEAIASRLLEQAASPWSPLPDESPAQEQRPPQAFIVEAHEHASQQACCQLFGWEPPAGGLLDLLLKGCPQPQRDERPGGAARARAPREAPDADASPPSRRNASHAVDADGPHALLGRWVCTGTHDMDAFLQDHGVSWARRMAAKSAKWPEWEFLPWDGGGDGPAGSGDGLIWKNHTMIGILEEHVDVGGPQYTAVDGEKNEQMCEASWEGGALVIERRSALGHVREERRINERGELEFTLRDVNLPLDGDKKSSWGRTFQRA